MCRDGTRHGVRVHACLAALLAKVRQGELPACARVGSSRRMGLHVLHADRLLPALIDVLTAASSLGWHTACKRRPELVAVC